MPNRKRAKLFPKIKLSGKGMVRRLELTLAKAKELTFSLIWTQSRPLVLMSLQTKKLPGGLWVEHLEHYEGDNDGEISVGMGSFSEGPIKLRFAVGPLADVPKCAAYVIEGGVKVSQVAPAPPAQSMALKQGKVWEPTVDYKVGG